MATEGWERAGTPARWSGARRLSALRSSSAWRRLVRSRRFSIGAAVLLFWAVDALAWRALAPYDPDAVDADRTLESPSADHWLGTDDLGRDVLSRVLAGASSVLTVAPPAALLAVVAGVALGLAAGYLGGRADTVLMRLVDALLTFPLVVGAVLALAVTGASRVHLVVVIALVLAPLTARTVRAAVRAEREREYVEAARLRGDPAAYVMLAEILPNVAGVVVAEATARLAAAIFAVTTLSFLGLGIQQPSPDWGLSVALGRVFLQVAPWVALFPALALATLLVAATAVADALREELAR